MNKQQRPRSTRHAMVVVAVFMAVAGIVALIIAISAQRSAPQPSARSAGTLRIPAPRPSTPDPSTSPTTLAGLPASDPTTITIASIGVESRLISLGQNVDGTVQVPDDFHVAGWYNGTVTPGQLGPSVIVGHVDSTAGPGIFFRLGAVKPGDPVVVQRADGTSVTFNITGVREYPKNQFPSLDVYGNTTVPTIRLVTCGGTFDRATGHYLSNIVAFGQLA